MNPRALLAILLCLTGISSFAAEIVVSAASSLSNAFTEIGTSFEAENPGVTVHFNFAGSGTLLTQVDKGAPVDIFASADSETMERAVKKRLIATGTRRMFAINQLLLVVPKEADGELRSLADLAKPEISGIAIGDPDFVPAGRYAREILQTAKLWDGLQQKLLPFASVRRAAEYVALGEADAGFVFQTDAMAIGEKLRVVEIPKATGPIFYYAGVVESTGNMAIARKFVEYLMGENARNLLKSHGFVPP